ncbi:MAG: hypothetical protein VYD15_06170, partial [Actinomycetota bacterium]|nr:hypothetical protein [Actinomycetota bacterium]
MKENLFSSPFSSALTIVTSIVLLTIIRALLSFIFNPIRQWNSTATNMQLFFTRAYPDEQYIRVWFSLAVIIVLTSISMAVWRAGSSIPLPRLGRKLLAGAVLLLLLALLAPFSTSATIQWTLVAACVALIGEGVRRSASKGGAERTVSSLTVLVVTLAGLVASLWVVPYGHHTYIPSRQPRVLAESGT